MIATAVPVCPAGTAVAYFRLEVRRPGGAYPIPIDRVNRLQKGDTVVFFPSDPPVPTDVSGARVALMLLLPVTGEIRLLETRKANSRQEWVLPENAGAVGVAYGPRGLDEGRMRDEAAKDPELIAQLAEYSEKTAQTEIVLSALTGRRQSDDRAVDGALQGLAATGSASKLDRSASLDQQTLSLFRTLNPAIGAYDPLAPEPQQRWQQSAVLASSVAGLFFGNTVGLAGGGAALFLNMRSMLFPKTELRSALLREAPEPALCAAKSTGSRTKFAFLWARRLPQGAPPHLRLLKPAHLAIGLPATIPVEAPDPELISAARSFRWKLIDAAGKEIQIAVGVPVSEKALRIPEIPKSAAPGQYRLIADWDWTRVEVTKDITLHRVPELAPLQLTPESADHLITGSGPVRVLLKGAPTYFIQSLHLLRLGDPLAKPVALPFAVAPDGDWLEFEVNTGGLTAGAYQLTLVQQGGSKAELPLAIQPPLPTFDNLPIPVHQGTPLTVTLAGRGLDRVEKLTSKYATIDWDPASRQAQVTLMAKSPAEIGIEARVAGRHKTLPIANAIRALGPKPLIEAVTSAPQQAGAVERLSGEIDTALPAAFSLQVKNLPEMVSVKLTCQEPNLTAPQVEARRTSADTLYFTLPAQSPAKCTLLAAVNESEPASLGRTVALPSITQFGLSDEPGTEPQTFRGTLRGQGLEAIARTGWTDELTAEVTSLPTPEGEGQKMDITVPWPSPTPHAPLRIWLRGEAQSRLTTAKY